MNALNASSPESSDDPNLGEVIYKLCVNILLYVVLITVLYMVVRFYLEDENIIFSDVKNAKDKDENVADSQPEVYNDEDSNKETPDDPLLDFDEKLERSRVKSSLKDQFLVPIIGLATSTDWEEDTGTREEVIRRAIYCGTGLIVTFCSWALLQERMLCYPYGDDYFLYSYGLVFFTRVGSLALSAFLFWKYEVKWVPSSLYEYSFPSVANMLSSWCQYEALKYISFPTQVLAKAFKLVPVMLMGKYLHNKSYEGYEYTTAAVIGIGLYIFLDSSEHFEFDRDFLDNPSGARGTVCGVVLLLLFLFFDSFTGQCQTQLFQSHKRMPPIQMMLVINAFSAVFSFITLVHQQELGPTFVFVYTHPVMTIHLTLFCLFATVGQLYIFYTVKQFGPVVFSVFMSLRILFSILLSCLVYSHPFTEMGVVGMILVFGAITYRIKRKNEDKPLFSWKDSEKMNRVVFQEWHDQVDV